MALLSAIARLLLVLAVVTATVALAANKWRDDRPSDRFPGIVQDVAVIALFMAIGTMLLREQLLATSAVGAVVVGFALQDTLGNLFAGLAIQIEKPFRVGHWIRVGEREGQVQEVTWRATKLRTKDGEFLIVPNSLMAKDPVLNYSEPSVANIVSVEVGTGYETPPNDAKRAILEAIDNAPLALKAPAPQVLVRGFGASAVEYQALFWVDDYGKEREARDQVRVNLWYTLRRHGIEIPWPIQIEYSREEKPARTEEQLLEAAEGLGRVDLFATQSAEARQRLAAASGPRLFAAGEAVVRQGAAGDSMFVVLGGAARVTLEPSGQEVAVVPAGGFFGEMSMLTGDPRTATVRAIEDVRALEISAADFRELAVADPALLDHISSVVTARRTGLDQARASAAAVAAPEEKQTMLARMRKFLHV
ncbi:MAG: mechanosensitive ion channel family protein [Acidobacteriota bacterium]|nr:mechanosensitive ion channel family protein [Acidobacteriota bacterium]